MQDSDFIGLSKKFIKNKEFLNSLEKRKILRNLPQLKFFLVMFLEIYIPEEHKVK